MSKAKHIGTCQVCGRSDLKVSGGTVSRHGYTITYGWQMGTCHGSGYAPLEHSCEQLKIAIVRAGEFVKSETERVKNLAAGHLGQYVQIKDRRTHTRYWQHATKCENREEAIERSKDELGAFYWIDAQVFTNSLGETVTYLRKELCVAENGRVCGNTQSVTPERDLMERYIRGREFDISGAQQYIVSAQATVDAWGPKALYDLNGKLDPATMPETKEVEVEETKEDQAAQLEKTTELAKQYFQEDLDAAHGELESDIPCDTHGDALAIELGIAVNSDAFDAFWEVFVDAYQDAVMGHVKIVCGVHSQGSVAQATQAELERTGDKSLWTYEMGGDTHHVTAYLPVQDLFAVLVVRARPVGGPMITHFNVTQLALPEHYAAAVAARPAPAIDPLCAWVKGARASLGLSQKQLGDRVGMNQSAIARVERGQLPNVATLRKLCQVLGPYTINGA